MSDDHAARTSGAEAAGAAAARLVGAQARVVGASWSVRPGKAAPGSALTFACGTAPDEGAGWIDIDLVPAGRLLALDLTLTAQSPGALVALVERGLVGILVDGRELLPAAAEPDPAQSPAASPPPVASVTGGAPVEVLLSLRLAVQPGQLMSLRLGLDDLGGAGPVRLGLRSACAVPTLPGPAAAPGRMRRRAGAGAAAVLAGLAGTPASANGRGAVANPDFVTAYVGRPVVANLLANDTAASINSLQITHINGVAIRTGQTVTLPSGHQVTLNADRTVTILAGPATGTTTFAYRIATGQGNGTSSTSTVTLTVIPCFVAGARIAVPGGEPPVETLCPGDLVLTRDHGPQPIRWAGARRVAALGPLAPVRIAAGTLGAHRTLLVSPQHRILLRGAALELMFGLPEALAAAKDLVDGARRVAAPGPQTAEIFLPRQLAEIAALFPAFDPATGQGYGRAARPLLRRFEVQALRRAAGSTPGARLVA